MVVRHYFYVFLLFTVQFSTLYAYSYLYPVMEANDRIYLLYQHDQNLDLLAWDPKTYKIESALPSWYIPTNIILMPGKQSFSFIDSDTIKIKAFNQRTPYTIPLQSPLYNFTLIHWLNDNQLYCSAMKQGHFGIYEIDRDGCVIEKVFDKTIDCMYPQKIDGDLYYIARKQEDNTFYYSIRRCLYSKPFHSPLTDELYLDCGTMPLMFLSLHPVDGGGVLSYEMGDSSQEDIVFHYFLIQERSLKKAFSFKIPQKIIMDSDVCLCESLLPVVPRFCGTTIYYVSSDGIYKYFRNNSEKVLNSYSFSYFVPLCSGFYGGLFDISVFSYYISDQYNFLLFIFVPQIH